MSTEDETEDVEQVEESEAEDGGPVHCRHCGYIPEAAPEQADWLCPSCGRYQDSMACPVCGQPTRISTMPAEHRPAPHAASKRRKAN